MAYNRLLFFSLTRYTFPTSPFPISLILSKLPGPTSTCRTLMLLLLYVRRKAILLRILPGLGMPFTPGIGSKSLDIGTVSTIDRVLPLLCTPSPFIFGFSSSEVCGLLSSLPLLFFLDLLNRPCALGALATRRSFRASSSFPVAADSVPALAASILRGVCGVSGGEGGTLLSLW